ERWMHGRQQARFSPFSWADARLEIDSIRPDGDRRRLFLTIGRTRFGRDSAVVLLDVPRRRVEVLTGMALTPPSSTGEPGDVEYLAMKRPREIDFETDRVWDLVPSLTPESPRVGLVWRDTIGHASSNGSSRSSIRGTRVSRVVRDTVVDGRRLWVVKD